MKYPHKPPDADYRCPDCAFDLATFNDDGRCPTAMLARIAELESQLAAKSEWEASEKRAEIVGGAL